MTINKMNLTQVKEAIGLAEVNLDAVAAEARAELADKLRQLYARRFELEGAAKRARTQKRFSSHQRFSRFNQPVACRMCGKKTTWSEANGCVGLDLCRVCFEQANLDNAHYDGYHAEQPHPTCRLCKTQEVK